MEVKGKIEIEDINHISNNNNLNSTQQLPSYLKFNMVFHPISIHELQKQNFN